MATIAAEHMTIPAKRNLLLCLVLLASLVPAMFSLFFGRLSADPVMVQAIYDKPLIRWFRWSL